MNADERQNLTTYLAHFGHTGKSLYPKLPENTGFLISQE